jgi:molybdenum cofactor biosynthesis protein B
VSAGAGTGDAPAQHRAYAPRSVRCYILTVSDSRSESSDSSGSLIEQKLRAAGHDVAERAIVPDEAGPIRRAVLRGIERSDVDAVIVTCGTGVSPRDVTPETVEPLLERRLTGFGELFRMLSYQEIGAAAILSRAVAGTACQTVVYVLPGSSGAVQLGMERLILPELAHVVGQLRRASPPEAGAQRGEAERR